MVVAVPLGVAASIVYGTSIVVQHRTAQQHADEGGQTSASSLWRLARNPLWLIAVISDFAGFLLQAAALSAGSVVVIQPLVVLMLPVALAVSFLTGGHRPRVGDYLGCLGVLGGLAVFLALIGRPGEAHVPRPRTLVSAVVLVLLVGLVIAVAVLRQTRVVRGAVYGGVAGAYFGTLAVMVDAASDQAGAHGIKSLFTEARGLVPIICLIVLGAGGILLTQMSFQVGALGATLPTNLAADPTTAVVLGAVLLHEHIPLSPWHLIAYALCLAAVVLGAVRLADPHSGPIESDSPPPATTAAPSG